MNTSILKDAKYREMVKETKRELDDLHLEDKIRKWETFLLTIKSKSMVYSQAKNKIKRNLKDAIKKEIYKIEENELGLQNDHILKQYTYLNQKLKEIEETEKGEPDIAFYSKLEERKIAKDRIGQLAETKKQPNIH